MSMQANSLVGEEEVVWMAVMTAVSASVFSRTVWPHALYKFVEAADQLAGVREGGCPW